MKRLFLAALLAATGTIATSETWSGITQDGVRMAEVNSSSDSQILVLCDVGVNAPITSVNFSINGIVPMPQSTVRLAFDKEKPLYLMTDVEGGLASLEAEDARNFEKVVALLKKKSKVKVRIFDGSEGTFRLTGSSDAIGDCQSDYSRYRVASN